MEKMISKSVLSMIGGLWIAVAAAEVSLSPLDRFVENEKFCAYMVSPPGSESEEFLIRYQKALVEVIFWMRNKEEGVSDTQAIFAVKDRCKLKLSQQ